MQLNHDEIQDCPRAIQSLKYFCEDMPDLHVIAAGSLLSVALREEGISFPVGKVNRIDMYPMSFEEFVSAEVSCKSGNSVIRNGGQHLLMYNDNNVFLAEIAGKTLFIFIERIFHLIV